MLLYIMRHGIAFEHDEWHGAEYDRPLTAEGLVRTRKVVKQLHKSGELNVAAIWSSPLARALQTAEIAGAELKLEVQKITQLECGARLHTLLKLLQKEALPPSLLSVGHEPDCGAIVGDLIGERSGHHAFKKGGVARLEGEFKHGGMKLIWLRTPKDVLGE